MALVIRGSTQCILCGRVINAEDQIVGFPAFLSPKDPLRRYSDAAFHDACFQADLNAVEVQRVYSQWRAIYESRPRNLATDQERNNWADTAFANFRREYRQKG